MGITIHLPGTDAGMILRMEDEGGCCHCFLNDHGERLIGSQPAKYVVKHLLEALADPQANLAGVLEGHPVSWVMSLSSPHVSIYSAAVEQDQWLLFQNAEAVFVHIIILTPEQSELWKSRLKTSLSMLGQV